MTNLVDRFLESILNGNYVKERVNLTKPANWQELQQLITIKCAKILSTVLEEVENRIEAFVSSTSLSWAIYR